MCQNHFSLTQTWHFQHPQIFSNEKVVRGFGKIAFINREMVYGLTERYHCKRGLNCWYSELRWKPYWQSWCAHLGANAAYPKPACFNPLTSSRGLALSDTINTSWCCQAWESHSEQVFHTRSLFHNSITAVINLEIPWTHLVPEPNAEPTRTDPYPWWEREMEEGSVSGRE